MITINEIKDRVVRFYVESNKGNLAAYDELLTPDFVSVGGGGLQDVHGREPFKEFYHSFLAAFPDLVFTVDDLIAEGNLCVARSTLMGTHKGDFMGMAAPTGKAISWTGTGFMRFNEAGLMDTRWLEMDGVALMQQLGVIPAPTDPPPAEPIPPRVTVGVYGTSPSENKAAFRRFIEEVWNKGNLDVADQIFHPGATSPSAPMLPTGGAGVRVIAEMFRTAMPDYHMDILDIVADGDRVAARFTQSGTHTGAGLMGIPPSGKKATWGEMGILRFAGGQVVESWYHLDMLGLMQQLGVGGPTVGG